MRLSQHLRSTLGRHCFLLPAKVAMLREAERKILRYCYSASIWHIRSLTVGRATQQWAILCRQADRMAKYEGRGFYMRKGVLDLLAALRSAVLEGYVRRCIQLQEDQYHLCTSSSAAPCTNDWKVQFLYNNQHNTN